MKRTNRQPSFISHLHPNSVKNVLLFQKEYPKIYNFIASFVNKKKAIMCEYNMFLRAKDKMTHEQFIDLGYEADFVSSPSFGSKWFYKTKKVDNFFYADAFQYIWNNKK